VPAANAVINYSNGSLGACVGVDAATPSQVGGVVVSENVLNSAGFRDSVTGTTLATTNNVPASVAAIVGNTSGQQRIAVTFSSVPAGVGVILPTAVEIKKPGAVSYGGGGLFARLLDPAAIAAGGQNAGATTLLLSAGTSATVLSPSSSVRNVTVYYQLDLGTDLTAVDSIEILPSVYFAAGAPDLSVTAGISAALAPSGTATVNTSGVLFQRFGGASVNAAGSGNWLTFGGSCGCTLLFPYVTDASGYDTGIAVANTSKKITGTVFGSDETSGPLTLRFFNAADGTVTTQCTNTSSPGTCPGNVSLAPGATFAHVVSQNNATWGLKSVANFTGYVAVTGNFNFCHGFGYISAAGAGPLTPGMSVGYQPVVVGQRTAANFDDTNSHH